MAKAGQKTTTYPLDWEVLVNLESRLKREFQKSPSFQAGTNLMLVSIGARLGLRVIDSLQLRWGDLTSVQIGELFIRKERKTEKERILVMSSKLKEVTELVSSYLEPAMSSFILSSQKGKGLYPMSTQNFNRRLKFILKENKVRYIGNCSSHILRKTWVVGAIRKGFEEGDHLSLIKVSKLVGHNKVSTTLRYTNFETAQSYSLYELE
jgi:integrase